MITQDDNMKFPSLLGWFNYHIFWTGLVITKDETGKYKLQRIKAVFGHRDKAKIWHNIETKLKGLTVSESGEVVSAKKN